MATFNCLASYEAPTLPYQPSADIKSGYQVLETEPQTRRLGKKAQPAIAGGRLERLGASLVRSFKTLRDSIRHLLSGKGCEATKVAPSSVISNSGEPWQPIATSTVRRVEGSTLAPSRTCLNVGLAESSALPQQKEPEASVRDVIRREWREMGKGLNALYLRGCGRGVPDEALRVLMTDMQWGTARVEAFDAQLASARRALKSIDQVMSLQKVIDGFCNIWHFPTQDHALEDDALAGVLAADALAAFVGGMTSFADSFAREYAGLYGEGCLREAPVACVENFVLKFLTELTGDQAEQLKARLSMAMSKQARQIFTFAYEQVELSGDSKWSDKLSRLGFGVRVLDALRKSLGLEPVPSVEWVSVDDLDIYELAALDRVLKRV